MLQQGDDPPVLLVGTEVSAKYKGAFCEAKIRKVVRSVKCRVVYKSGGGPNIISDEQIVEGDLRVGETVQVKLPDKKDSVTATIAKIQDGSHYTVVFDDGDITTLRRSALCLKSGRHFNASETLDQLPLTHPEHFGNPVVGRRGRRHQEESSDDEEDEDEQPVKAEKEENIGKVVCVESTETKKKSQKENWFPGLVVAPTAQDTVRIRVKDEYLVRSFKDGRYYTVPKNEATTFTRDQAKKQDNAAVQAALEYLDKDTLPPHWDRDVLFGLSVCSEVDLESDSSDDEPREEKDHFVAQLYKYMDDRGTPLNKGPQISNRDIDLYRLFRAAQKLGGYNRVTSQNQWKAIAVRLGFAPATNSITNLVKQAYKKFLQPFEDFNRKLGCTMVAHPRANRIKGRSLVRASSVASPKPSGPEPREAKSTSAATTPVAGSSTAGNEEYENTSESSAEAPGRTGKKPRKLSMSNIGVGGVSVVKGKQRDDPEDNEPIVQHVVVRNKPGPKPKNLQQQQPAPQQQPQPDLKDKDEVPVTPSTSGPAAKRQSTAGVAAKSEAAVESPSTPVGRTPKGRGVSESSVNVTPTTGGKGGRKKKEVVVAAAAAAAVASVSAAVEEKPDMKGGNGITAEKGDEKKEKGDSESERSTGGLAGPGAVSGNGTAPTDRGGTVVIAGTGGVADDFPVEVGDKLKVFYHEKKVTYEAKVLEISADNLYLVHYTGWNTRYDEWVPKSRIAENLTSKQKRTKGGVIVKSSSSSSTPSVLLGKIGVMGASKRGRGGSRSDSLPPRSTTPCSVTSNSSRTKSPATPAQRRTTRGQQSTRRRTSNNTDISSMPTDDSDTDSDEPVKKPTRSSSLSLALPPGRSVLESMRKDSKDANSSTNEDEATKDFMEYIDIEQMRSGMKAIKSPSPDAEQSPTSSVHLDHKTSLFHLSDSNTDSNEQKASKESGSSSDTQSFDEEDSQGFVGKKTVTTTPSTGKGGRGKKEVFGGRKSGGVEKYSDKSLSKILGTDSAGGQLDKDLRVEVAVLDMGKKPLGVGKGGLAAGVGVEKGGKAGEKLSAATGRKTTGEKLGLATVAAMGAKQEKVTGKAGEGKPGKAGIAVVEAGDLKGKKDEQIDSDVYEFKEPEPFEFEAATTTTRKPLTGAGASGAVAGLSGTQPAVQEVSDAKPGPAKGGKKRILDMETKNNLSPQPNPGKKVKRSPGKATAAATLPQTTTTPPTEKAIKREDVQGSDPFDVLRKSPNFNVPSSHTENLPEFTQKLSTTEGFTSPVSSPGTTLGPLTTMSMAGASVSLSGKSGPIATSSASISSAFVNTRNDEDQWQSLRMFKSAVEGQIDMEDVLAKTKVPKERSDQQKSGDAKSESRSSIADKFLKTLNHGGSTSNSSSPSSSSSSSAGEGPSGGNTASGKSSGSIFGRDFAEKLEPKIVKKEHLKLDLAVGKSAATGGLVSSPDKLDTMLELNLPKNNVLSETIQKLKSAINDDDEAEGEESGSTDSERERLVIEDDEDEVEEEERNRTSRDAPKRTEEPKMISTMIAIDKSGSGAPSEISAATAIAASCIPSIKEELTISSVTLKEQSMSFATKFQESFYSSQVGGVSMPGASTTIKCEVSEMDLTCKESFDDALDVDKKDVSITLVSGASTTGHASRVATNTVSVSMTVGGVQREGSLVDAKDPDSLSLLLCEETIPTSPSPWQKSLMEKSAVESRLLADVKSLGQTPNSSPRDSQSPDDSKSDSEDLKNKDSEDPVSAKKRRKGVGGRRSPDLDASTGKRRKLGTARKGSGSNLCGGNGGSDSDNSDPLSSRQQLLRRSPKPCQFNFLVQLDPSLSSHQKIAILEKKIQELRKTYNMIKSDLASIDRRRKKLRRRGRETKKNQQQKMVAVVN